MSLFHLSLCLWSLPPSPHPHGCPWACGTKNNWNSDTLLSSFNEQLETAEVLPSSATHQGSLENMGQWWSDNGNVKAARVKRCSGLVALPANEQVTNSQHFHSCDKTTLCFHYNEGCSNLNVLCYLLRINGNILLKPSLFSSDRQYINV